MGKKPAVKTAQAPALVKEDLATQVLCIQQHQAKLYEAIMAQGQEEVYSMVKEAISRSLEKGKIALLEEGYKKRLKDGKEQRRAAEREAWEMNHSPGNCMEPQTQLQEVMIDKAVQTEPTSHETRQCLGSMNWLYKPMLPSKWSHLTPLS